MIEISARVPARIARFSSHSPPKLRKRNDNNNNNNNNNTSKSSTSTSTTTTTTTTTTNGTLKSEPSSSLQKYETYIVGTNHNSKEDAERVTRVIRDLIEPDVVVVELDFLRLETISLSANAMTTTKKAGNERQFYGKDLLNAVKESIRLNSNNKEKKTITLLGDVRLKEIPMKMLISSRTFLTIKGGGENSILYFLKAFENAFGALPTVLISATTCACAIIDDNFIETFIFLLMFSLIVNVVLQDRDANLANNVLRGLEIAKRLRENELIYKQFSFSTTETAATQHHLSNDDDDDLLLLPIFTLKRPFENGDEIRRLNLFEPRWLKMLDLIAKRNNGSLIGAKLGVVYAQNRLYLSMEDDEEKDKEEENMRVARIVFDPFVKRATVVDANESLRPVTGNRIVEVFIALDEEANDDFIGEFIESSDRRGFLLAARKEENSSSSDSSNTKGVETNAKTIIKCVVVCGLLHVPGVVAKLKEKDCDNNTIVLL